MFHDWPKVLPMTTVDQQQIPEHGESPVKPASRLRELLNTPNLDLEDWQAEAAKMVSLLAVQFPQEADEGTALSIVALVNLAAAKGVKEAKKKSLKLTRWSKSPPLPIQTLPILDEQRAAVLALSIVKSPWALSYVEQALVSAELPDELLPEFLQWGRTAAPDWATFVVKTYAASLANCSHSNRAMVMLKEAPKLLKVAESVPLDKAAETIGQFIVTIVGTAKKFSDDEKAAVSMLGSGFAAYQQAWQATPALLMQPAMVNVLRPLSNAIKALKKKPPGSIDAALLATLSLVGDMVRRFGAIATEQFKLLLPMWIAAYPDFQKQVKIFATSTPELASLLGTESETSKSTEQNYNAEVAFATLLPAWDAFVAELPDPSQASSVGLMLSRAAGTVQIERHGVVGEVVDYDPLSHHLADPSDAFVSKVKVLRAGVIARRADGSVRTLVQALVTST
jgi:hypothetical protein